MAQARTLLSVQYLRGLAALAVVALHTGWTRTTVGAAGVDLFFVISGFIIVLVGGQGMAPAAFLRARALRVVPLYWLLTLALAGAGLAMGQAADPARLLTSLAFWPRAGFDGRDDPVLIQGWTLNCEAFFYLAFAAVLLLPARLRLLALTGVFAALSLAGLAVHPAGAAGAAYTSPLLLEFLAGAWLCRAWQRKAVPQGDRAALLLAAGVLALAVQAGAEQVGAGLSDRWQVVAWGLPALLILAGALGLEAGGTLPRVQGLRALGDASYALYLTHLMVLWAVLPVLHPWPVAVALPLALLACVAAALLVHHGVERPVGRLLAGRRAVASTQGTRGATQPQRG